MASIRTRYARLCCEGRGGTDEAFSGVWTGIVRFDGGAKWAQVGYTRRRNAGTATYTRYRKAECQGNGAIQRTYDTMHAPVEGDPHVWKVELDNTAGTWTYSQDGTSWETFTNAYWVGRHGDYVDWNGEILNREDDMSGTDADRCIIRDCQYRDPAAAYADAGITQAQITAHSDDLTEWNVDRVSGERFDIWDVNPNP